jgi:hypothetical protein
VGVGKSGAERTLLSVGEWPLHIITVIIFNRFASETGVLVLDPGAA